MSVSRRVSIACVLGVLAVLMAGRVHAATVLLLPATGEGISPQTITWARGTLLAALSRRGQLRIIDMDRPPGPQPMAAASAGMMALSMQAQLAIALDLRRGADDEVVLTVKAFSAPEGREVFTSAESTALGPQALVPMIERVPRNLFRAQEAARCEAPSSPRTTYVGFRAGAKAPLETAGPTPRIMPAGGLLLLHKFSRFFMDLGLDFARNEDPYATSFGLGAYVPHSDEGHTPYLGLSVRFQESRFGGQGAAGLAVVPAIGMVWWGDPGAGLRIEAGFFYNAYQERALDRLIPGSGQPARSYGPELWMSTWF